MPSNQEDFGKSFEEATQEAIQKLKDEANQQRDVIHQLTQQGIERDEKIESLQKQIKESFILKTEVDLMKKFLADSCPEFKLRNDPT
ncbi:MAG: hypothetical protein PHG05_00435 [Candidatus Nanoarchaeia archaeon]|nr:hypothetical protein [Candidatus Nanoarchaeia archaeon]